MRTFLIWAASMCGLAFMLAVSARGQEAPPASTVWDKVYSLEQATRGKETYMAECSACHSEDLGGSGYAPALKGDEFASAWNEKTVGDLFQRITRLMPPDNPGSLPPDKYRDVIAFVFQENKYPEGDHDLPTDVAALRQIKMTAPKTP